MRDGIFQGPCTCEHRAGAHGWKGCLGGMVSCPCTAHWIPVAGEASDGSDMSEKLAEFSARHPSTQEKLRWLIPNPNLPAGTPSSVAELLWQAGVNLAHLLKDGPQLTIALQRMVDAKDAAVRQAIADGEAG